MRITSTFASWTLRLAHVGICLLFLSCALLVLGAHLPAIPYLGSLGSIFVTMWTPWFVMISVLGLIIAGWRFHRARKGLAAMPAIVMGLTLIGAATIFVRIANVAAANHIPLDMRSILDTSFVYGEGSPDASDNYGYFQGQALPITIYRPSRAGLLAPVLIYVHGGGWVSGSHENRGKDMRWFADHGWLVFAVDYTLSSDQLHLWDQTTGQVGCAMGWVGRNASRFGGDASRLAMVGESAGGNLVINASYMANGGTLAAPCGAIPKVSAVSAAYPVVDAASFYDNPDRKYGREARRMASGYLGGSPRQFPERYDAVRSASHLNAAAPPTLIIVGEHDHFVPPEPDYSFAILAQAAGIETLLIRVPYGEHAFDAVENSLPNQIFRQGSDRFFRQHLMNADRGSPMEANRP